MPILLLLFGGGLLAGTLATATGAGVANATSPTKPTDGGVNDIPAIIFWPVVIGGTFLVVKYGGKYLKKL